MQKRSLILLIATLLGIGYLWPWAIRQKMQRLEAESLQEQQKANTDPPTAKVSTPVLRTTEKVNKPVHLIFPVKGHGLSNIVSYFGDPREGGKRRHEGVDIAAARGTPVVAVANGIVDKVKEGGSGGKQIWLILDNGWQVYYAHLHTQLVTAGSRVKAGDLIATVGNTGNAINAGPHLHFCLYPSKNKPVNPLLYLPGQLSLP